LWSFKLNYIEKILEDIKEILVCQEKKLAKEKFYGKITIEVSYNDSKYRCDTIESRTKKR